MLSKETADLPGIVVCGVAMPGHVCGLHPSAAGVEGNQHDQSNQKQPRAHATKEHPTYRKYVEKLLHAQQLLLHIVAALCEKRLVEIPNTHT